MKNAVVIGAGIGGIATAIRLANKGFKTKVFEVSDKPGGKLNEFSLGEYRFDFGPSLFTLPELVNELFRISGRNPDDYFEYDRIELACKYFWQDGTVLMAWSDPDRLAGEVEKKFNIDKKRLLKYLNDRSEIYKTVSPLFLERSLHKFKGLLPATRRDILKYIFRLGIITSMNRMNKRELKHPKLVQLFNRMATYNGSNPYQAPAILTIISSLEHGDGVYFPVGGMYSITKALVKLAKELGVEFLFNEKVLEISRDHSKVTGVRTLLGEYPADLVVSNMDVVPTYKQLLNGFRQPTRILDRERSSSALVFYWGIGKSYSELELHNIFFSDDYKSEFDALFKSKRISRDPTIYVHISSRCEPGDAPEGSENWFVMVNAPSNYGQKWDSIIERTRENVIEKLEKVLGKNIRDHINEEYILDPRILEDKTFSFRGSLYGTSSNSKFAAFLRHPNFSSKIKGLYFTGGSVHPGGGIPLCLLSAKIVSEMAE